MKTTLLILGLSLLTGTGKPPEELGIAFLDVGYGDAILITQGDYAALIDTGYPEREGDLFAALDRRGIDKLDFLLLTHPHPDHLGNAAELVRRMQPKTVADNGERISGPRGRLTAEMIDDYTRTVRENPRYRVLSRGDTLILGQARLEVIWPPRQKTTRDWNSNSAVILLSFAGFRALLAGDANQVTEQTLLDSGESLQADLLKVGHHGAGDTAGVAFLQAVKPRWAAVSVGKNPWGIPAPETIRRLQKAGARVFLTSRDGDIFFRVRDGGQVWIHTDRIAPPIFFVRPSPGN